MKRSPSSGDPVFKELKLVITDIVSESPKMKPSTGNALKKKSINGETDDGMLYKLNKKYFKDKAINSTQVLKKPASSNTKTGKKKYQLHEKQTKKTKSNSKIKVKFWTQKTSKPEKKTSKVSPAASPRKSLSVATNSHGSKVHSPKASNFKTSSPKTSSPKLKQKVSLLPPPIFGDEHAPMVTVPDDLTVHFNEEEANDLLITADSDQARAASARSPPKKQPVNKASQSPQSSPRNAQKRRREDDNQNADLEYFAKYVVQKLRKMETNQRIYSENLINTVLMLGQLQHLNGKSRVGDK